MSNRAWGYLIVALAAASAASLATSLIIGVHPFAEMRGGFFLSTRLCGQMLGGAELRGVVATALVLTFALLHMAAAGRAWLRTRRQERDLTDILGTLSADAVDAGLGPLIGRLGLLGKVSVVETDEALALTLGSSQPRIYISRGATDALSPDELEAVLYHEKYHLEERDPKKVLALTIVRSTIGYLPLSGYLARLFLCCREFEADDLAIRQTGRPELLLQAFLKLSPAYTADAPAAGYSNFAAFRIARLKQPGYREPVEWRAVFVLGALTLAMLVAPPAGALALTELLSFP